MSTEKLYRISWEIDMPGVTPEEAIKKAMHYLAPLEPARWCYSAINRETGEVTKHEGQELNFT